MFGVRKAASEFVDGLHDVQHETERLKTENAELRECLQDFAYAINHNDGRGVDLGWMLYRIREFGIEVDG